MENFKISNRRPAFTLVELLVVISIITFLAGLLLPVLIRAKQAAQSAKCQSNLCQIGIGLAMYVADNQQRYVPGSGTMDELGRLVPYVAKYRGVRMEERGIFNCPTIPASFFPREPMLGDAGEFYSDYVYNSYGTGWGDDPALGLAGEIKPTVYHGLVFEEYAGLKESMIKSPIDMAALGDLWAMRGWLTAVGNPNRQLANQFFCDGHVENARRSKLLIWSAQNFRRWNYDNEPHPESWRRP